MRDILNKLVAVAEKQKIGEHARKTPIPVLKWVDLQELNYEIGDDKQWVESALFKCLIGPFDKFLHFLCSEKCRCSLEHDLGDFAVRSKYADRVLFLFVAASMRVILVGVFEKLIVKRSNDALSKRQRLETIEHILKHLEITLYLLRVSIRKL